MSGRLTRRGLGAAAAGMLLGSGARAAVADADLTLILMGDLHSGYRWSSRLLAAVRAAAQAASGEVRIIVNGDVFEHNNAVARRGDGVIDDSLIRAFAAIAPTLVTIGNHDSDLFDPRIFASRIAGTGAVLLSDITDPRTGGLYGAAAQRIDVRGHGVSFVALGTPVLSLYPTAYRDSYRIPDPAAYAAGRLPALFGDAALPVALVHAGFGADRSVLPHLPPATLLHGAHDHLRFSQPVRRGLHLHSGAWSNAFQLVEVRFTRHGPVMESRDVVLDAGSPQDAALQQLVDGEMQRRLEPADRAVLGRLAQPLGLDAAVLRAADWVRAAADAELGLLSHTTFGDGLPAGPVTAHDLSSFMRFDGGIAVGEIPPGRLGALLARTNQFDATTPYARRTGDYLYATAAPADRGRPVRVAINAYAVSTAANRIALLGWDAPGFRTAQDQTGPLRLGRIIAGGLAAG